LVFMENILPRLESRVILDLKKTSLISRTVLRSRKIALVAHRKPDLDAVGSSVALKIALEKIGKECFLFCGDALLPTEQFLLYANLFSTHFNPEEFETIIFVDCGSSGQTVFLEQYPALFKRAGTINLDHHPGNDFFAEINLVHPEANSTALIVYNLLRDWRVELDHYAATALLAGIYGDTGGMRHANTIETFEVIADLLKKGADLSLVIERMFYNLSPTTLRLWGRVLENVKITEGEVLIAGLQKEDFQKTGAALGESAGLIDLLKITQGIKYAVLLTETEGEVHGQIRTVQPEVNVAEIARRLGGGGHTQAAAFRIKGKLERREEEWVIVEESRIAF